MKMTSRKLNRMPALNKSIKPFFFFFFNFIKHRAKIAVQYKGSINA